eukprot:GILJ01002864.1.p1 GENE.GILJ01002864.1~~GILJ01002864.1.p1  ORF type:complete len:425 (-),score=55.84 GILJ01002864.1:89-1312(-)
MATKKVSSSSKDLKTSKKDKDGVDPNGAGTPVPAEPKKICLRSLDGSIYYGFVHDEEDKSFEAPLPVSSKDPIPPPRMIRLRHGEGISIGGQAHQPSFVQGHWKQDKLHGRATIKFPSGAHYSGDIVDNNFEGKGVYHWPEGHTYSGDWVYNKMHGSGVFTHAKGLEYEGIFHNNYFLQLGTYVDPFLSAEQLKEDVQLREQAVKMRAETAHAHRNIVKIYHAKSTEQVTAAIAHIMAKNRTPLILETSTANVSFLGELQSVATDVLDLRDIAYKQLHKMDIKREVREKVARALSDGGLLLLNLDDSEVEYTEVYDPDLYELYNPCWFPKKIWQPDAMKNKEVWRKVLGVESDDPVEISPNYKFGVWSKYRLDKEASDATNQVKIERRFRHSIPLYHMAVILYDSSS